MSKKFDNNIHTNPPKNTTNKQKQQTNKTPNNNNKNENIKAFILETSKCCTEKDRIVQHSIHFSKISWIKYMIKRGTSKCSTDSLKNVTDFPWPIQIYIQVHARNWYEHIHVKLNTCFPLYNTKFESFYWNGVWNNTNLKYAMPRYMHIIYANGQLYNTTCTP